jgi:hypothetical protein
MSEAPPRDSEAPSGSALEAPSVESAAPPRRDDGTPSAMIEAPQAEWQPRGLRRPYPIDPDNEPPKVVDVIPDKDGRKPWDRMAGETIQAYRAFAAYRDMDPAERSVRALTLMRVKKIVKGREVDRPAFWKRLVEEWSQKWRWHQRAIAWDDEAIARVNRKKLKEAEVMHERHANVAVKMQALIIERLNGMQLERQARGEDRIGQAGNAPGVNVNVGVAVGQARAEVSMAERTPVGEFLTAHPDRIPDAVSGIAELLELTRAANAGESA